MRKKAGGLYVTRLGSRGVGRVWGWSGRAGLAPSPWGWFGGLPDPAAGGVDAAVGADAAAAAGTRTGGEGEGGEEDEGGEAGHGGWTPCGGVDWGVKAWGCVAFAAGWLRDVTGGETVMLATAFGRALARSGPHGSRGEERVRNGPESASVYGYVV